MAKYISNRQQNLKIGIVSYTENQTVLEVTGKVGIGTTNPTSKLHIIGDVLISGVATAVNGTLISGLNIQSSGTPIGTSVTTINFVGAGLSVTSGTSGISTVTVPGSSRSVNTHLATQGQTTFSASYTVGYVDVFLNGAKLSETQYSATNGTEIVLNQGASLDDVIETVGYNINNITTDISPVMMGMIF
jgi:hypothetical protein